LPVEVSGIPATVAGADGALGTAVVAVLGKTGCVADAAVAGAALAGADGGVDPSGEGVATTAVDAVAAAVPMGDGVAAAVRDADDVGVTADVLSDGATVATLVPLSPVAEPRSAIASTNSVAASATRPIFAKRTRRRTPAAEGPPT
jgi:hypothetical protein